MADSSEATAQGKAADGAATDLPPESADPTAPKTSINESAPSEDGGETSGAATAEASEEEDEWMDVLGTGNLRKRVIREGRGRETRPTRGQVALIKLRVTVDDVIVVPVNGGEELEARAIVVGEHDDALAFDLILPLMEVGEICEVTTTTRYDNRAVPSTSSAIGYTIELLGAEEGIPTKEMEHPLRVKRARAKKDRANDLHARGMYDDAASQLRRAITYLTEGATEADEESEGLTVVCFTNLAAALLKLPNLREAVKACDAALELQPGNEKALFRKAKALTELKEYSSARELLSTLLKATPSNGAAHKLLGEVKRKQLDEKEQQKALAKRMVSALDGSSKDATAAHEAIQRKKKEEEEAVEAAVWDKWTPIFGVAFAALSMFVIVALLISRTIANRDGGEEVPLEMPTDEL